MKFDFVLIASSTGGPEALDRVCTKLSANFPSPILIVQHMPAFFTNLLANSLTKKCKIAAYEAKAGQVVIPNQILIAPGGQHSAVVNKQGRPTVKIVDLPPVNGVRPAADVLFNSIAENFASKKILAVVLTGMGQDGMRGVRNLKDQCDCYCLAQNKESSVIYGMPRSVIEADLADEIIHLDAIGSRINFLSGAC